MNTVIPRKVRDSVGASDHTKHYTFSEEDLNKYAVACHHIIEVIKKENPDVYFCPLRGSYPLTRIVLPHSQSNIGNMAYITTSGFLLNRRDIIRSALETILRSASEDSKILITDTSITGSSIRDLRNILKQYLIDLMPGQGLRTLDLVLVKLWQGRDINQSCATKYNKNECTIKFTDYNFGVPTLFCEDDPNLLGIDYLDHAKQKGKKHPHLYQINSRRGIWVVDGDNTTKEHTGKPDSDIFIDLINAKLK